jgi:hypothetical protein
MSECPSWLVKGLRQRGLPSAWVGLLTSFLFIPCTTIRLDPPTLQQIDSMQIEASVLVLPEIFPQALSYSAASGMVLFVIAGFAEHLRHVQVSTAKSERIHIDARVATCLAVQ